MSNDWRLLRQYVEGNSEEAFTRLAGRHLDMVYTTCLREIGDAHLAEDAAQAVFLLLARKAPSMRREVVIGGWLFQAARLVSKNTLRVERRRRLAQQRVEGEIRREMDREGASSRATSDDWSGIEPHLHRVLSELRPRDRDAILLRFFEERSLADVGAALGLSEDAARMRVSRALEKMRRSLGKSGVAVTAAGLGVFLTTRALQTAPPACAAALPKIAAGTVAEVVAHLAAQAGRAAVRPAAKVTASALATILAALAIIALLQQTSNWLANRVPTPSPPTLPDLAAQRKQERQRHADEVMIRHQLQAIQAEQLRQYQGMQERRIRTVQRLPGKHGGSPHTLETVTAQILLAPQGRRFQSVQADGIRGALRRPAMSRKHRGLPRTRVVVKTQTPAANKSWENAWGQIEKQALHNPDKTRREALDDYAMAHQIHLYEDSVRRIWKSRSLATQQGVSARRAAKAISVRGNSGRS